MNDHNFVFEFLNGLSGYGCVDIYLPHSKNLLYFASIFDRRVRCISYIEDGLATRKALNIYGLGRYHKHKPSENNIASRYKLRLFKIAYNLMNCRHMCFSRNLRVRLLLLGSRYLRYYRLFDLMDMRFKFGEIITSFETKYLYVKSVNIAPKFTTNDNSLFGKVCFFVSYRYLSNDNTRLLNYLKKIVGHKHLVIIPHPGFWKDKKKMALEKFLLELQHINLSHSILSRLIPDVDISFEVYMRGTRLIIIDTGTIQVTIHSYQKFFHGLKIIDISSVINGENGILENILGYVDHQKKYI